MAVEARINTVSNGDTEILVPLHGGTYQVVWERSWGSGVFNPSPNQFSDFARGVNYVKGGEHKLLFGVTLNGACPADCLDCPFGRTIMARLYTSLTDKQLTLARPISSSELQSALERAKEIAIKNGILSQNEVFAAGALLAGDPGYSPHISDLIATVSGFTGCEACRWSTVAPDTENNVLGAFIEGATRAKEANPTHTLSFQVSLHSTDHQERINHTGVSRLLSMQEISMTSQRIRKITGRKLSLSFVLHEGSVLDPQVLNDNFSPDNNLISLRPIYSRVTNPMNPDRLIELYSKLRKDNWDVVYMPPSQSYTEGGRPIELHNMRS